MRAVLSSFLGRMIVLGIFLAISLAMFLYMLAQTGTRIPLIQSQPKTLTFYTDNIDNLVAGSQVQIAGVRVGSVTTSDATPRGGEVTFFVDQDHWPLHQGLKIRIGQRSLVGETYVELHDGTGAPIPENTTLPDSDILPVVTLYNVYDSLSPDTRQTASYMLQSLGASTEQTRDQVSATFDGLTALGRGGHTAIDAIAAQDTDLRALTNETATLLNALDTGEGQIANMVTAADQVTQATAGQRPDLEATMRLLPTTMDDARNASDSLVKLSGALGPVTHDLRDSGPMLRDALVRLPDTTRDLRHLMPPAHDVLDRAPRTLERVSPFSDDVDDVIDPARDVLADANPVVGYLHPYGLDIATFLANFNAALQPSDSAGRHIIRALPIFNEKWLTSPVSVSLGTYVNPFPRPGAGLHPGPWSGKYPHIERAPR
jgi:phospholipid/cholesterol/gamma-HCH transport system substrate-binding protein